MTACLHPDLILDRQVTHFPDARRLVLEFTIRCGRCGTEFRALGLEPSGNLFAAHCTPDYRTVRVSFRMPEGAEPEVSRRRRTPRGAKL